jgi:hypothetical protein
LAAIALFGHTGCEKEATESEEKHSEKLSAKEGAAAESNQDENATGADEAPSRELTGPVRWTLQTNGPVETKVEGSTVVHNADCKWKEDSFAIKYEGVRLRFNDNKQLYPVLTSYDSNVECGSGEAVTLDNIGGSITIDGYQYTEGSSLETDDSFVIKYETNTPERVKGTIAAKLSQRQPVDERLRIVRSEDIETLDTPLQVEGTFDSNPETGSSKEAKTVAEE